MGVSHCPECFLGFNNERNSECPDCYKGSYSNKIHQRNADIEFEERVIRALIKNDNEVIRYWIKSGICSRDYINRIRYKVSYEDRNPCSEVSISHPTARVEQNYYLLIG